MTMTVITELSCVLIIDNKIQTNIGINLAAYHKTKFNDSICSNVLYFQLQTGCIQTEVTFIATKILITNCILEAITMHIESLKYCISHTICHKHTLL